MTSTVAQAFNLFDTRLRLTDQQQELVRRRHATVAGRNRGGSRAGSGVVGEERQRLSRVCQVGMLQTLVGALRDLSRLGIPQDVDEDTAAGTPKATRSSKRSPQWSTVTYVQAM